MSDEPGPADREIARFYTRSRKFPRMVGRLPEGTRIWGGPYTFTQLGLGLVAVFVALATRSVWSWGSVLIDLVVIMGVGWGIAYVGRFIPMTNLNPLVVASTALGAFSAPTAGTYRGRSVALARPHIARGRMLVDLSLHDAAPLDAPNPDPARPDPPRAAVRRSVVSSAVAVPEVAVPEVAAPEVAVPEVAVAAGTAPHGAASRPNRAIRATRTPTTDRAITGLDRLLAQTGTTRSPNGR